jgi:hypothetical protein
MRIIGVYGSSQIECVIYLQRRLPISITTFVPKNDLSLNHETIVTSNVKNIDNTIVT